MIIDLKRAVEDIRKTYGDKKAVDFLQCLRLVCADKYFCDNNLRAVKLCFDIDDELRGLKYERSSKSS